MAMQPVRKARPADVKSVNAEKQPSLLRTAVQLQATNRAVISATIGGPRIHENVTNGNKLNDEMKKVEKANGIPYPDESAPGDSKVIPTDNFLDTLIAAERIIEPPFDPLVMAMLPENSTELRPCVEALEINIDGFGHRFSPRVNLSAPDLPNDLKEKIKTERAELANFFNHCSEDSFVMLRRKTRHDLETTGNAYWEVIRAPATGKIQAFNHIPSYQMRLGVIGETFVEYERNRLDINPDNSVRLVREKALKRFRMFVQAKLGTLSRSFGPGRGHPVRWFKEYMDPRVISAEDGSVITDPDLAKFPDERRANEVIHWKLYSPRSPYGLPRFVGNLITIFGDRAAEEINFITLRNNNIPSMAVCVSNGQLTEGTISRIQEFVENQIQGSENYSRFLIIEAEGAVEDQEGAIKVDIKPLTDQQMRDQMFQEYGKNNGDKIRRAFRLPPIFLGMSDDYNKSSAEESRKLADEQIFKPERDEFDNKVNKFIMTELGAVYHAFRSNGPNVTDDQDMIQVLVAAERTGGLTPRISREIVSEILGRDLPDIDPTKIDPDVPFSLQLAERVKNMAATQTGTPEPGSQITAMKNAQTDLLEQILMKRDTIADELDAILSLKKK